MAQAYILTLPQELLQDIASYVDISTDILNLRLSCKDLAGAAFDRFAEEYISELSCFVLDPKRLERIVSITARPHLARKIEELTFNSSPFERKYHSLGLPAQEGLHELAHTSFVDTYSKEQFAKLGAPDLKLGAVNLVLVEKILRNVGPLPECTVRLDAQEADDLIANDWIDQYSLDFVDEILKIALRVGTPIGDISLSNRVYLDKDSYRTDGDMSPVLPMLRELRTFSYRFDNWRLGSLGTQAIAHFDALQALTRSLTRLTELDWAQMGSDRIFRDRQDLLMPDLRYMPQLQILSLCGIECSWKHLRRTLAVCGSMLVSLRFEHITLEDIEGEPLLELLHFMSAMPSLSTMTISMLKQKLVDGKRRVLEFLIPGDTNFKRYLELVFEDLWESRPFLDCNLSHGLSYRPY